MNFSGFFRGQLWGMFGKTSGCRKFISPEGQVEARRGSWLSMEYARN
jgi:hypothetical protein